MLILSNRYEPPVSVQGIVGELDIFGAVDVRRALCRVADQGCDDLRLNLSGVTFVDAAALGHLASTWANLTMAGLHLGLTGTSPSFDRICRATGRRFD